MDDPFERFILDLLARLPPPQRRAAEDMVKRGRQRRSGAPLGSGARNRGGRLRATRREGAVAMFHVLWIRLHGVFRELLDAHRPAYELSKLPGGRSYFDHGAAIYEAAQAVLECLDDEEHVAADYFRQRSAHLRQTSYTVRLVNGGREVQELRKIGHIDKTFTIEEVDGILRSLISKFGNEVELAVHIARRVRPHVAALSEAMEALHRLPPVR